MVFLVCESLFENIIIDPFLLIVLQEILDN